MADVVLKGVGAFEIKDAEKGEVEAVIATLDVVDREGDVITKTAITPGAKVKVSSYGHDAVYGAIPVGKGVIDVDGDRAIFKGRLFLATPRGRETFDVLKEMGAEQEWSFGFRILGSEVPDDEWRERGADRILTKLDAFEVSPVILAAGKGTRTVGVKDGATEPPAPVDDPAAAAELERIEADRRAAESKAAEVVRREAAAEADRFERMLRRFRAA